MTRFLAWLRVSSCWFWTRHADTYWPVLRPTPYGTTMESTCRHCGKVKQLPPSYRGVPIRRKVG